MLLNLPSSIQVHLLRWFSFRELIALRSLHRAIRRALSSPASFSALQLLVNKSQLSHFKQHSFQWLNFLTQVTFSHFRIGNSDLRSFLKACHRLRNFTLLEMEGFSINAFQEDEQPLIINNLYSLSFLQCPIDYLSGHLFSHLSLVFPYLQSLKWIEKRPRFFNGKMIKKLFEFRELRFLMLEGSGEGDIENIRELPDSSQIREFSALDLRKFSSAAQFLSGRCLSSWVGQMESLKILAIPVNKKLLSCHGYDSLKNLPHLEFLTLQQPEQDLMGIYDFYQGGAGVFPRLHSPIKRLHLRFHRFLDVWSFFLSQRLEEFENSRRPKKSPLEEEFSPDSLGIPLEILYLGILTLESYQLGQILSISPHLQYFSLENAYNFRSGLLEQLRGGHGGGIYSKWTPEIQEETSEDSLDGFGGGLDNGGIIGLDSFSASANTLKNAQFTQLERELHHFYENPYPYHGSGLCFIGNSTIREKIFSLSIEEIQRQNQKSNALKEELKEKERILKEYEEFKREFGKPGATTTAKAGAAAMMIEEEEKKF